MRNRGITRRDALKLMGGLVGAAVTQAVAGPFMRADRGLPDLPAPAYHPPKRLQPTPSGLPNFIVILVDDQRWDHLSCMGHPFLETPNMDRLAAEGVLFQNAFVTTSLCSPSRASLLTGLYAHTHGVKNNLTPWDNTANTTFMEHLHTSGYHNAFIGKWHMPGNLPQLRGVDRFITFTAQAGQGQYFDCPLIIDGVEVSRPGKYITEDLTDFALEFMRLEKDGPFCLYLAHKAAHHQFLPPPELKGIYRDKDLSFLPPESFPAETWTPGAYWEGALGSLEVHYRNYCETLAAVDQQLGRLLDELDVLGISQNTVVIFTSDNGYSWGEHIRNGKRWATEENLRVPLLIRYPQGLANPGSRPEQMALNIDLASTILDFAQLPVPSQVEGSSLKPLLENQEADWRSSFLYEYFKDFPYNVPEQNAVRTAEYLYIEYEGRRKPELFNILRDPRTLENIIETGEGQEKLPELQRLLGNYLAYPSGKTT